MYRCTDGVQALQMGSVQSPQLKLAKGCVERIAAIPFVRAFRDRRRAPGLRELGLQSAFDWLALPLPPLLPGWPASRGQDHCGCCLRADGWMGGWRGRMCFIRWVHEADGDQGVTRDFSRRV